MEPLTKPRWRRVTLWNLHAWQCAPKPLIRHAKSSIRVMHFDRCLLADEVEEGALGPH